MKKLSIIVAVAMLLTTLCLPVAAADRYVEDIYDTAKFLITFDNENGLVDEKGTYTVNDINGVEIIEGVNGNAMKAQASNYDEATDTYTPKDTYLEVENMLFGNQSFTVSFWCRINNSGKPTGGEGDCVLIGNKDWDSGKYQGWLISIRNTNLKMNLSTNGTNDYRQDTAFDYETRGEWEHLTFVFNAETGTRSLFVNGALRGGSNFNPDYVVPEGGSLDGVLGMMTIGNNTTDAGVYLNSQSDPLFDADFDDVAVFDYALTGDDAAVLYNNEHRPASAPGTFDFGVIAVVSSIIALGGIAVSKKR